MIDYIYTFYEGSIKQIQKRKVDRATVKNKQPLKSEVVGTDKKAREIKYKTKIAPNR